MADKNTLNGYSLHKQWFEFAFSNPDLISPAHGAIMSWLIELNNKMDWREKFASPASQTMAATGISSYNTYKKVFKNLIEWGFIHVIKESKNQYTPYVIALSKSNKALKEQMHILPNQVLTEQKEMPNHKLTTQNQSIEQSTDSIYKPLNIKPIKKKTTTKLEGAFAPPSLFDVVVFFMECGFLKNEAQKFYYYYSNQNWCIKDKQIRNWQQVAKTWQARKPDIEKEKGSAEKEKENSEFLRRQFKVFHIDYKPGTDNYQRHKLIYAELLTKMIECGFWNSFELDVYLLSSEIGVDTTLIIESIQHLHNKEHIESFEAIPDNKRILHLKLPVWK